jgi:hypothetical protein
MARPFLSLFCPSETARREIPAVRRGYFSVLVWVTSPGPKIILSQQAFEFYASSSSSVNTPGVRPSLPILHAAAEEFL